IKSMREMYLSELNDLYWKTASEMQQHDSLPRHPQHEKIEKLKIFKMTLERIVLFLRFNKSEIQLSHKEKMFSLEEYITFFLSGKNIYARQPPMLDSSGQDIASEFDRLLCLID
ncbi:hypothetical protein H5410_064241, partial [Solanum commersonii]